MNKSLLSFRHIFTLLIFLVITGFFVLFVPIVESANQSKHVAAPVAAIEIGQVLADHLWKTVPLKHKFINPVVVASSLEQNNTISTSARIRNLQPTGFDIRLQDQENKNLAQDFISYIVLEEGKWEIAGVKMESHFYTTSKSEVKGSWKKDNNIFHHSYSKSPTVFYQVMSDNDVDWASTYLNKKNLFKKSSGKKEKNVELLRTEAIKIQGEETIGWIAIESDKTINLKNIQIKTKRITDVAKRQGDDCKSFNFLDTLASNQIVVTSTQALDRSQEDESTACANTISRQDFPLEEDREPDKQRKYFTKSVTYLTASGPLVFVKDPPLPPPPTEVWIPPLNTSWQWQLTDSIDESIDVDMYDIDLFDVPVETIGSLRADGKKVICYISAGSLESWRPDIAKFPAKAIGNDYAGWPGEKWIDIRHSGIRQVMLDRFDLAVAKGCDGIEPDNIQSYLDNTGFPLTYDDQIEYNRFLANEAHNRNLSIGLKNNAQQIPDLVHHFDWVLNESCFQYNECEPYLAFIENGKAVFSTEYIQQTNTFCPQANAMNFNAIKKKINLNSWVQACR